MGKTDQLLIFILHNEISKTESSISAFLAYHPLFLLFYYFFTTQLSKAHPIFIRAFPRIIFFWFSSVSKLILVSLSIGLFQATISIFFPLKSFVLFRLFVQVLIGFCIILFLDGLYLSLL